MAQIVPNIILLGVQGSGKSTQAEKLADKYNYNWIIAGQLIRNAIKKGDSLSRTIDKYVKAGKLVPQDIIFNKIFKPHLLKVIKDKKGIIFDGIPRDLKQMQVFHELLDSLKINRPYLVYLSVPDKVIFQRILSRKICPNCGKAYKPDDKEYEKNTCSKCNISLESRSDDTDTKALNERLSIFHNKTLKIVDYYKKNSRLIKIDGTKSIDDVSRQITKKIEKLSNEH